MLAIFDCDGVLVDSEVLVVESEEEALNRAGFPASFAYIVDNCVGLSYGDFAQKVEADFGAALPPGFFDEVQRTVLARFPEHLKISESTSDLKKIRFRHRPRSPTRIGLIDTSVAPPDSARLAVHDDRAPFLGRTRNGLKPGPNRCRSGTPTSNNGVNALSAASELTSHANGNHYSPRRRGLRGGGVPARSYAAPQAPPTWPRSAASV